MKIHVILLSLLFCTSAIEKKETLYNRSPLELQTKEFKMGLTAVNNYYMGNFLVDAIAFFSKWGSRIGYIYWRFSLESEDNGECNENTKSFCNSCMKLYLYSPILIIKKLGMRAHKTDKMPSTVKKETEFELADCINFGFFAVIAIELLADFTFNYTLFMDRVGWIRNLSLTLILPIIFTNLTAYYFDFYSPFMKVTYELQKEGDTKNGQEMSNFYDILIVINLPLIISFFIRFCRWRHVHKDIEQLVINLVKEQEPNRNKKVHQIESLL